MSRNVKWHQYTVNLKGRSYPVFLTMQTSSYQSPPSYTAKDIVLNGFHVLGTNGSDSGIYYSPTMIESVTWKLVDKPCREFHNLFLFREFIVC